MCHVSVTHHPAPATQASDSDREGEAELPFGGP